MQVGAEAEAEAQAKAKVLDGRIDGRITYTQWLDDYGKVLADLTVTKLPPHAQHALGGPFGASSRWVVVE